MRDRIVKCRSVAVWRPLMLRDVPRLREGGHKRRKGGKEARLDLCYSS
jgi:hypothetical protein